MTDKRIATTISVPELFRLFPDEDACYRWLERVSWNGEPVCPHCGGVDNIGPSPSKPHTYWHKDCRKHFTVTTKTCMHATKRPLQDWIYAIYSVMTARKGCLGDAALEGVGLPVPDCVAYAASHPRGLW